MFLLDIKMYFFKPPFNTLMSVDFRFFSMPCIYAILRPSEEEIYFRHPPEVLRVLTYLVSVPSSHTRIAEWRPPPWQRRIPPVECQSGEAPNSSGMHSRSPESAHTAKLRHRQWINLRANEHLESCMLDVTRGGYRPRKLLTRSLSAGVFFGSWRFLWRGVIEGISWMLWHSFGRQHFWNG